MSSDQIQRLGAILSDAKKPLKARFRALFALRSFPQEQAAVKCIEQCLTDPSVLLQHELAFCLGQMQNALAVEKLCQVLEDASQHPITRHEAGEALGAIADPKGVATLEKYSADTQQDIRETCQLALARIKWAQQQTSTAAINKQNPYDTVDPTPPLLDGAADVASLGKLLVNPSEPLYKRYQAMFSLRNIGTKEAIHALAQGLFCTDSALLRHEVAFVLGQTQSPEGIAELKTKLALKSENCMVRHECAEALGAIATQECKDFLAGFLKDEERVVRESCEVALDIADYETGSDFNFVSKDAMDRPWGKKA